MGETETPTPVPTPTPTDSRETTIATNVVDTFSNTESTVSSSSNTPSVSTGTTEVNGGDTVIINGKELRVSGYVDLGNGEKIVTYIDYDPNDYSSYGNYMKSAGYDTAKEYYLDSNATLQELDRKQVNTNYKSVDDTIVINGKEYSWNSTWKPVSNESESFEVNGINAKAVANKYAYTVSFDSENSYPSTGKLTGEDSVTINGKKYVVDGYVDVGNGQKRVIYSDPNASLWGNGNRYYINKNGELVKANADFWNQDKLIIDGDSYYFTDCCTNGDRGNFSKIQLTSFEPSENDKKIFDEYDINKADNSSTKPGVNYDYDSNSYVSTAPYLYNIKSALVKRKRYYIKFYNQFWQKQGPYDADEARKVAINTYNLTPGQGNGAYGLSKTFQISIGNIRYILEEVAGLAKDAIKLKDETEFVCVRDIQDCLDMLDDITPSVFTKFKDKSLVPAVRFSNESQKSENSSTKSMVSNKMANLNYTLSQQLSKEEMANVNARIAEEEINEDVTSKYSAVLNSNEYTSSSITITSSLPREKGEVYNTNGLYVNFVNTEVIIDDLKIAINEHVLRCNNIIDELVANINKIPGYISGVGRLVPEDVNEKLNDPQTGLRIRLKNIRDTYIKLRDRAKEVDNGVSVNRSNGGNNGGGSTRPYSTQENRNQTVALTRDATEVPTEKIIEEIPTERPTVPVTTEPVVTEPIKQEGGPLPSTPTNGGGNNNGYGGNNYWGGNNYSSNNETPTEVSTTLTEPTFDIKEGNKFKLPTSTPMNTTTTTTTTQNSGNSVIPVLAGLSAAAAAGIGAKAYMDRKKNRDNDEEEFKSEDWSTDSDINIEYHEPSNNEPETLDFDDTGDDYQYEEPEKYDAKTHQELENLQ